MSDEHVDAALGRFHRQRADHQLVQHDAKGVDVRPRVDVHRRVGLLGTHVRRGADGRARERHEHVVGQLLANGLCDAEVDDFGLRQAVLLHDEHVGRLEIPMNDAFLMRVLYGTAHVDEEDQSLSQRQSLRVAVLRDRQAAHQLHREVRIAGVGLAGMQHLGDSGVVHERQRLTLGGEARDDLARELCGVYDLDGNAAPDEARFLGLVHGAHASLTQ